MTQYEVLKPCYLSTSRGVRYFCEGVIVELDSADIANMDGAAGDFIRRYPAPRSRGVQNLNTKPSPKSAPVEPKLPDG